MWARQGVKRLCVVSCAVMQISNQVRDDLEQITQVISLVTDAHSTAIFLPTELLSEAASSASPSKATHPHKDFRDTIPLKQVIQPGIDPKYGSIDLVAVHSYSKLVRDCRIQVGHGLLGWVSEQGRPIHLSPCDVGSSALAIYVDPEPIRSLLAVPISTRPLLSAQRGSNGTSSQNTSNIHPPCGVLMCDSIKEDGFSSNQVKVLEHMSTVVQRLLFWTQRASQGLEVETSWEIFKQKTAELGDAIGHNSIEILRIRLESLNTLESKGGISLAVQLSEQFIRLAQQSLPPHFPCVRLPNGDIALAVDNMMSGFFQQKLHTLSKHLSSAEKPLEISIECYRANLATGGQCNVDATLQQQPISVKTSANLGGIRA